MMESQTEEVERYTPQHPLPEQIRKMEKDETVCRYCGVSYLIHSEIKALEKKVKALEQQLEHYKGCEEREIKLKEELQVLMDRKGEFEMEITVKDASIATLTNNLRNEGETCKRLRTQKDDIEDRLQQTQLSNKQLKERSNALERVLPTMQMALRQQKIAVEDIHSFMEKRDQQMKEEMAILLSHVTQTCQHELKEKVEMQVMLTEIQARFSDGVIETEDLQRRLATQEDQIQQLDKLFTENKALQQKCTALETAQAKNKVLLEKCSELEEMKNSLRNELEAAIEKSRSLQMESHQFREQYKTKSSEMEELTALQRHKEQSMEMTTQKLKSELKKKENDLLGAKRELQALSNKLEQQLQMEADLSRKASKTINETRDIKESFFKAKEEIDTLKEEREAMITSHQNRIEQLRESFKEKLLEADSWQEKLDLAIQKEKERHAQDLRNLEARLKESFVMELEIEKGKYRELMKKYQMGSQETEEKLRSQIQSIEARYKGEIADLNELLAENKRKMNAMEDELRREIASLKSIIKDLEGRLARLDVGNEDIVAKLKAQLRETHQELEDTTRIIDQQKQSNDTFQQEIKHLQDTVRRECEERFELTEALSTVKEELLQIKKPPGCRNSGGYSSLTPRQQTNLSLPGDQPVVNSNPRRSISEPNPVITNRPITSKGKVYNDNARKEYTMTNSNTMVFDANDAMSSRPVGGNTRAVGGSSKRTGGTLAENRRRIAAILGRK